jgi:hypothetical protein
MNDYSIYCFIKYAKFLKILSYSKYFILKMHSCSGYAALIIANSSTASPSSSDLRLRSNAASQHRRQGFAEEALAELGEEE